MHIESKGFAAALALALGLSAAGQALAQEVTLTVHHFLGPNSTAQRVLLEPWAQRVQEQSGGRIAVEIYPAMSMGGAAPELYRQVRDGVADIVWTLPSYTPGLFKRLEVFELPGVHQNSAEATTLAIQDLMPELAEDLQDVHPLLVHVHSGYVLHMRGGAIEGVGDLQGMRLRTPSRIGGWLIEAWGAEPVNMPVPDLPQALSRGAVEGALLPFEAAGPMGLAEITGASVEGPEGARAGTMVFLFAMNRERYESLPEDLRAVIDANSGLAIAPEVGAGFDAFEAEMAARMAQTRPVVQLSPEAWESFRAPDEAVAQRWIADVAGQGIDGAGLIARARAAIAAHSE